MKIIQIFYVNEPWTLWEFLGFKKGLFSIFGLGEDNKIYRYNAEFKKWELLYK